MSRPGDHPDPHSFPTRRSSDLPERGQPLFESDGGVLENGSDLERELLSGMVLVALPPTLIREVGDRKSTRLNSSHITISYAVFCLKKKQGRPSPASPRLRSLDQ